MKNRRKLYIRKIINLFNFPYDILIIITILLVIVSLVAYGIIAKPQLGAYVEIYENNILKYRYSLGEEVEIKIDELLGQGSIIIKDKKVKKSTSSCSKDDICTHHDWIGSAGEMIICVPNKQVIKISGEIEGLDSVIR